MKRLKSFNEHNSDSSWIDAVVNSLSDFTERHPDLLDIASKMTPEDFRTSRKAGSSKMVAWRKATKALVEPEGMSPEEEEVYGQRSERSGFDFVKGVIHDVPEFKKWSKVIDLLNEEGY